jgi:hypothetical protein
MSYTSKTWEDRISEYPNRRTLTKEDNTTEIVLVERNEGSISKEGSAFSEEEMNDLESRIVAGFAEIKMRYNATTDMIQIYYNNAWVNWKQAGLQADIALVPVLSADNGNVIGNFANLPVYRIFDGSDSTYTYTGSFPVYAGYRFDIAMIVNTVSIVQYIDSGTNPFSSGYIQYSDDGTNWYNGNSISNSSASQATFTFNTGVATAHRYWRVYFASKTGAGAYMALSTLQFYGR